MVAVKDMTGKRFGRLIVLARAEKRYGTAAFWNCQCDCGNTKIVWGSALRTGETASCGCLHRDTVKKQMTSHGMVDREEYIVWKGMKSRCLNPRSKHWHRYGGRGIKVCERWANSFAAFLEDMGDRPDGCGPTGRAKLSIDRFPNNNGNYEPGNCRWATQEQQVANSSVAKLLTFRGETRPIGAWERILKISACAIVNRLRKGWSVDDALGIPPKKQNRKQRKKK